MNLQRHLLRSTVICVALCAMAAAQPIGFVKTVTGRCWLKDAGSQEQPAAPWAPVLATSVLRCDAGGKFELSLRSDWGGPRFVGVGWTPAPKGGKTRDALRSPMDDWFKLGGAVRGGTPTWVYSPPGASDDGVVSPSNLVLRWIPPDTPGTIALSVKDDKGKVLWPSAPAKSAKIAGVSGELASPELRNALLEYRKSGGQGKLTLVLVNPEEDESSVTFSLLSAADEDSLQVQLEACDAEDSPIRSICRAYYFRASHLYTEAANEYEAALRELPSPSGDWIQHAIAAHALTGNSKRERELTKMLASLPGLGR